MVQEDYLDYLKDQITRAESKWARKWGHDEIFKQQLRLTIGDVLEFIGYPLSICCMGCRSGTEVFEFKEMFPAADVWGIDITRLVNTIKTHLEVHIILQDFNKLPDVWQDKFDLIFSNSLDHSYDPKITLKEWHRVSQKGGHLLLEFSTTPENNIEHTFNKRELNDLLPKKLFKHVVVWDSPERNIFTGLFEVIK